MEKGRQFVSLFLLGKVYAHSVSLLREWPEADGGNNTIIGTILVKEL